MTKQQLRQEYKEMRNAISFKDKMKWDDLLLIQFQQLSFDNIHLLFSYWPMANMSEPNTHIISSYLEHMYQVQIAYPVGNLKTCEMKAIIVDDATEYTTNAVGILEPKTGKEADPKEIDIVLVPLLIYDEEGYRVGFGKGFYDRYLTKCRKDVIKIGVSYFDPVQKIKDTNHFDVPLNYCITPQRIYEF
ncbi:MAG: 5-formyltetrahydrofolate cyclo-ligase [Bacteroidota bacterium]|nr:5-formyltetrahydrofolate cyclo-ligase [Bacteroidota bacterium]